MADLIRHPGQDFFQVTPPEDCRLEEQIGQRFGAERSEGRVELVEVAVHVRRALGAQVVDGGAPRLKARCKDHLADSLLAVIREVAVTRVDLVQIREELRRSQDGREVQVGVDLGGHVKVGVITPCLDVLEPLLRELVALIVQIVQPQMNLAEFGKRRILHQLVYARHCLRCHRNWRASVSAGELNVCLQERSAEKQKLAQQLCVAERCSWKGNLFQGLAARACPGNIFDRCRCAHVADAA